LGSSKGRPQFCKSHLNVPIPKATETITHRADKTPPTPLSAKRLHCPLPITNALLAALALWHSQTNVTCLAVGVALVDRELDAIFHERAVSCNSEAFGLRHRRVSRWEKRIAAFGTEEVLLVICTFSKTGIVERDETLVDDCGLAVVASRSIFLFRKRWSAQV
jgi:hypothetical protein